MKPIIGPLINLAYSRKALIASVDAVFGIAVVLITNHLAPNLVKEALAIIAILQPVVLVWINSIAVEDAAKLRS